MVLAAPLANADERGNDSRGVEHVPESPWVVFRAPSFVGQRLPHGGPDWSFETPRLPALAPDEKSILVAITEIRLGGPPNLALSVLRLSDLVVLSSTTILSTAEFAAAAEIPTEAEGARAFADLAQRVRARLGSAEASLGRERWNPLSTCTVSPSADAVQPPCAVKEQRLDCQKASLNYGQGALAGTWNGSVLRWRARAFRPAPVKDKSYGAIPVRACFAAAWFDPTSGVLAGLLRNECQRGGDWCIVQPTWYAKRLLPKSDRSH
jgi:hypothetical protein